MRKDILFSLKIISTKSLHYSKTFFSEGILLYIVNNIHLFSLVEKEVSLNIIRNLLHKQNFDLQLYLVKECNLVESILNILNSFNSICIYSEAIKCLIEIVENIMNFKDDSFEKYLLLRLSNSDVKNTLEKIILFQPSDNEIYSSAIRLETMLNILYKL